VGALSTARRTALVEEPLVSQWKIAARSFTRNKLVVVGLVMVLLLILLAVCADFITPYKPLDIDILHALQGPSVQHYFGTDRLGRDTFSRVIYGTRASLVVAVTSIVLGSLTGGILGLIQGYRGGTVDAVIGRLLDILFSFPALLLAIAVSGILGSGKNNAILAIAIVYAPLFARVMRGPVIAERHREYVEAARVTGIPDSRILLQHILPNVLPVLIVQASVSMSAAILIEAALSYIGLGTQPPEPSWGTMLNEGRMLLEQAPWLSIFPGLTIMFAVLAFNLFGDGVRDALDPTMR
jgi:peptide/nickel transport system permease protein